MSKESDFPKTYIMLHDDWEIYGDGTGDPHELMFEPARRVLDICEKYNAKYTFYAEVGQQLNMMNASAKKWQNYAKKWEAVLQETVKRGHDVQLHFHPQWIGAELKNGIWKLDYSKWSTSSVSNELLEKWIRKGKAYLERLLKQVDGNYQVVSFRAGGWLCQPSEGLYKALKKNDICCDVSVMKGRYKKYSDGSFVDFRDAVSRYEPWEVEPNNFADEYVGSGLYELPVFTEVSGLPHTAYLLKKAFRPGHYFKILKKKKKRVQAGRYSPDIVKTGEKKDYYGSFGYMHYKHLLSFLQKVSEYPRNANNQIPRYIIYLTHSKSFLDYKNFERFLVKAAELDNIEFITTRQFVANYLTSNE